MENKKKHAQKSLAGDYVHMWWPNGWSMYTEDKGDLYFRAGTYAMSWNVKSGSINRIGVVSDGKTQAQAAAEDNETVENMPASSSSVSLKANGVQCAPSAFGSVKKTFTDAVFDYSAGPDTTQPSRIEDSGAYMQRCDIPYITFDN
ncbi:MAG: hypothetical protein FWD23_14200, partial [Oscillospiraceae bacterium]|nr:hypothetical protein [Oscillospiraceae bacterium]